MQARIAQLQAARAGIAPAALAAAAASPSGLEVARLLGLLSALLHPDPAQRPTLGALLQSDALAEAYRLLRTLPQWQGSAPGAPAAAPASPSLLAAAPAPAAADPLAPAATPAAGKRPASASAAAAAGGSGAAPAGADMGALRHFMRLLRQAKEAEAAEVAAQLSALEADTAALLAARRREEGDGDGGASAAAAPGDEAAAAAGASQPPPGKRQRLQSAVVLDPAALSRLSEAMPQLEGLFFSQRSKAAAAAGGAGGAAAAPPAEAGAPAPHLQCFARDLTALAAHSSLRVEATLRSGDLASPTEMVRAPQPRDAWGLPRGHRAYSHLSAELGCHYSNPLGGGS